MARLSHWYGRLLEALMLLACLLLIVLLVQDADTVGQRRELAAQGLLTGELMTLRRQVLQT